MDINSDSEPQFEGPTDISDEPLAVATQEELAPETENLTNEKTSQYTVKTSKSNENDISSEQPTTTKTSRELKLLLELSKEANLDTNLVHKRKSNEGRRSLVKLDNLQSKSPAMGESSDHSKRSMRSQNPDFVAKHQKFLSKVSGSDSESLNYGSDSEDGKPGGISRKKKRLSVTESSEGDEPGKKVRKPFDISMVKVTLIVHVIWEYLRGKTTIRLLNITLL